MLRLRPTAVPLVWGEPELEDLGAGRAASWIGGFPFRPWAVRELAGQFRHLGIRVRFGVADTRTESWAGFMLDAGGATAQELIDPFAAAGEGVLELTQAAGSGVRSAAGAVSDAAGPTIQGAGDALRGAAGAVSSLGRGIDTLGRATTYAPTLFTTGVLVVGGVLGVGYLLHKAGILKSIANAVLR